ncbi:hypothetical protein BpHYR1_021393 [Brachionus plicatilis]|uniref:Uncharacterized protein n=1 Tax=Brachionus plicatilis TaxID=10195 RepID=A0A3M7QB26_BRAPC|nr:hypothetical protein BpHYR1_021393 [Brachionus plicatilis]
MKDLILTLADIKFCYNMKDTNTGLLELGLRVRIYVLSLSILAFQNMFKMIIILMQFDLRLITSPYYIPPSLDWKLSSISSII